MKKDRQCNGQNKIDQRQNNDLQNNTQKTSDRGTRTLLKAGPTVGLSVPTLY